jgi:hypothetical protein
MPKRSKAQKADLIPVKSEKFRTTPIKSTINRVSGLPKSAILYKCEASSYWQFRVFMEGKQRKRSTKEEELALATKQAKLIYADMLNAVNSGETASQPSSRKTLRAVANSLWTKNETRVKNKELHKDKVEKDKYVFERHIYPFFKAFHEEVSRRREQSILFATSTFALTALAATFLFFIQAFLWSGLYLHFGALNSIEHAVSFSLGVFTTYGNSGIFLGRPWVLLSEIQAVNGVMAFGITTAFLFTLAKRLQPRN